MTTSRVLVVALALAPLVIEAQDKPPAAASPRSDSVVAPGHWPQWRGPSRTNVSIETGLLKEWPQGGPKLLWKTEGLGEGVGSISIAGGLIFLMGYRDDKEFLTALDGAGQTVWSVPIGPAVKEMVQMRWLSQRTPTVDDDRVYAFTARGVLLCVRSSTGEITWQKEYERDFGGKRGHWGFCDFPLVDGDHLVCTPGGPKQSVVALDKRTGSTVWICGVPECKQGTHSSPVLCELAGVRQYVHQLDCGTVGISCKEGKQLWFYGDVASSGGNVHTAMPWKDNSLLTLCGWSAGCALLEFTSADNTIKYVEKYKGQNVRRSDGGLMRLTLPSWHGNTVLVGDRLYSGGDAILDLPTGKSLGIGGDYRGPTVTVADGMFYVRGSKGEISLVEAGIEKNRSCSKFESPHGAESTWTFPVVAGGRLYLRDQGDLYCYDIRGPGYQEPPKIWDILSKGSIKKAANGPSPVLKAPEREPDAIFVATPQDVVEKMLEAAGVTQQDLVYDLGSGDGRIVITAFKKYGCRSVGYEIDPRLVKESRSKIQEGKIGEQVTIEEKDLFTVDLVPASVVTLYLGAPNNARLLPQLRKLKPGSRIVSHAHLLGDAGPKPDREIRMVSKEDQGEHIIYVWTTPLKVPDGK